MADSNEKKESFFSRVKAEFKKIIWPDKTTVARQTVAVVLISAALGVIIKVLDLIFTFALDKLMV